MRKYKNHRHKFGLGWLVLAFLSGCGLNLLNSPAPLNIGITCQRSTALESKTISQQELELVERIKNNDPSSLEIFIQANPDMLENLAGNFIPLHLAAYFGNIQTMQSLLKLGAQLDRSNCDGNSALHFAAFALQSHSVDFLLEQGANPKAVNVAGDTPLHFVSGVPVEWLFGSMQSSNPLSLIALPEELRSKLQLESGPTRSSLAALKLEKKQIISTFLNKGVPVDVKNLKGRTPLFYAAMSKEIEAFIQLNLANGNILVKDEKGSSLLHQLALGPLPLEAWLNPPKEPQKEQDADTYQAPSEREQPLLNLIKEMIQLGVPIDDADQDGWRPLHAAALTGQEKILTLLLQSGAQVNAPKDQVDPLTLASALGDLTAVQRLMDAGARLNMVLGNSHALAKAASNGHESVVNYLLDRGYQIEAGGISALTAAVEANQEKIVKTLLEHKAQINFVDISNQTALISAFQTRNVKLVKLLLDSGASTSDLDNNGNTPWFQLGKTNPSKASFFELPILVSDEKKIDEVTFLKNLAIDLDFQHQNNDGNNVLHQWIQDNQTVLVMSTGAISSERINQPNSNGNTALHLAVEQKNMQLVKYLIAQGADLNQANTAGQTAMDFAIWLGLNEIAHYFATLPDQSLNFYRHIPAYLKGLEDLNSASLELLLKQPDWNPAFRDGQGKTLLGYVLTQEQRANNDNLIRMLKGLLDAGVPPNQMLSPVGQTPLFWLAEHRLINGVQLCLDKGADPNIMTTMNNELAMRSTALHASARNKDLKLTQLLLENNANPSLPNGKGFTALHYFVQNGQLEALKQAKEKGWQMDVIDWQGHGLLYWALENNQNELLLWLVEHIPQTQILSDLDNTIQISMLEKFILEKNELTRAYLQKKLGKL
jgi:ankyrin repeat protein